MNKDGFNRTIVELESAEELQGFQFRIVLIVLLTGCERFANLGKFGIFPSKNIISSKTS